MSLLSAYQDLITSQHRGKPRYMATVTALLKYSTDIYSCAVYLDDNFDLDLAEGAQENTLGVLVGQSRNMPFELITTGSSVLDDDTYRTLLKSKIAKNVWKGGIMDIAEIWQALFGERIKIQDNQDMTIEVLIDSTPTTSVQELILQGMVVPKPQSVNMLYKVIREAEAEIYLGAIGSTHKRQVISLAKPTDQEAGGQAYFGAVASQHKRYMVGLEPPTGDTSQTDVYWGSIGARHYRYQVGLNPPTGGDINAPAFFGAIGSQHKKHLIIQEEE